MCTHVLTHSEGRNPTLNLIQHVYSCALSCKCEMNTKSMTFAKKEKSGIYPQMSVSP
jgi:hypothetical protein